MRADIKTKIEMAKTVDLRDPYGFDKGSLEEGHIIKAADYRLLGDWIANKTNMKLVDTRKNKACYDAIFMYRTKLPSQEYHFVLSFNEHHKNISCVDISAGYERHYSAEHDTLNIIYDNMIKLIDTATTYLEELGKLRS